MQQIHCPDYCLFTIVWNAVSWTIEKYWSPKKDPISVIQEKSVQISQLHELTPAATATAVSPNADGSKFETGQLQKKSQPLAQLPNYFYKTAVWQYDILMDWNQLHFKWNMPLNYWLLPLFMLTRWWINTDCIRNLNLSKAAVWHLSDAITDGEKPIA